MLEAMKIALLRGRAVESKYTAVGSLSLNTLKSEPRPTGDCIDIFMYIYISYIYIYVIHMIFIEIYIYIYINISVGIWAQVFHFGSS